GATDETALVFEARGDDRNALRVVGQERDALLRNRRRVRLWVGAERKRATLELHTQLAQNGVSQRGRPSRACEDDLYPWLACARAGLRSRNAKTRPHDERAKVGKRRVAGHVEQRSRRRSASKGNRTSGGIATPRACSTRPAVPRPGVLAPGPVNADPLAVRASSWAISRHDGNREPIRALEA